MEFSLRELLIDESDIVVLYLIENKNRQNGVKILSEYSKKKKKQGLIFFIVNSLKMLEK